jgi:hypothetical protein
MDQLYHLAEVNIALLREPIESELLEDFVSELDPVNAQADATPGFVWRLQTDDGDATAVRAFGDDRFIVNMSVWESIEALGDFAYRNPEHRGVLSKRAKWFHRIAEAHLVLWWVPAGHVPTVQEAEERLAFLRARGPTPIAFTLKWRFGPPTSIPIDRGVPAGLDEIRDRQRQATRASRDGAGLGRRGGEDDTQTPEDDDEAGAGERAPQAELQPLTKDRSANRGFRLGVEPVYGRGGACTEPSSRGGSALRGQRSTVENTVE